MSRTPGRLSLPVVRGATWEDYIDYNNEDGTPIDLAGYEARLQVRDIDVAYELGTAPVLEALTTGAAPELTLEVPPGGTVKSRLWVRVRDLDRVKLLNPDNERRIKRAYGIELYKPAGAEPEYVVPFVEGKLTVRGELVRDD